MFLLSKEEYEVLRSQNATIENTEGKILRSQIAMLDDEEKWKSQFAISNSIKMGACKLPYAFTENGVDMLSRGVNRERQI